ncbi:MAG: hypothetical protein KDA91_23755 [Planctomycetaceae bacterium]|nr:hypothetical protein [Planctomycetaceae bacterium]
MSSIRGVGGVLLLILAVLKMIGLAFELWQGAPDRTTGWIIKQAVYAAAFASIGFGLLRPKGAASSDK